MAGSSEAEYLIRSKVAMALKSNQYKKINFKLNLCIGLLLLKCIFDIIYSLY